jgi:hypothetical protein
VCGGERGRRRSLAHLDGAVQFEHTLVDLFDAADDPREDDCRDRVYTILWRVSVREACLSTDTTHTDEGRREGGGPRTLLLLLIWVIHLYYSVPARQASGGVAREVAVGYKARG